MAAILDTHSFLWFISDDPNMSAAARLFVQRERVLLSIVSAWEIALKLSIGKLALHDQRPLKPVIEEQLQRTGISQLSISLDDVEIIRTLPFHHRDPFDRMIIAQALANGMPVVSRDSVFDRYGIQRIW